MTGIRTEEARAIRWDHVVALVNGQWRPVALSFISDSGVSIETIADLCGHAGTTVTAEVGISSSR
jgi:hypothetical protein